MAYVGNAPGQGGNIIRQVFAAGVGFTAGTSTTITLSTIPATSWSVEIFFNGVFQDSTQYSVNLSTGLITFTSAIPADITEIETLQVQVLNVGVPATGSVNTASLTLPGLVMPSYTTTAKNALVSPAAGLVIFDSTLAKLCVYSGAAWQTITSV